MLANPKAMAAMHEEWNRLWDNSVWDHNDIREWPYVAYTAQREGESVHMGRLFGLCVQKGSELPGTDVRKKFTGSCSGGHAVIDQSWESAIFQNLISSPSALSAEKCIDYCSCFGWTRR